MEIDTIDCSHIGTPIQVTLTVTNGNGMTDSCAAFVNIIDGLAPEILCPDNHTVVSTRPYMIPDYFATGEALAIDNCTSLITVFDQNPNPGTMLAQGTHTITLTAQDDNGFEGECEFILVVDIQLSIATIVMFPNPASNVVMVSNPQQIEIEELGIYDITGRLVIRETQFLKADTALDISNLPSAAYIVTIKTKSGDIVKQLLKE